MKVKREKRIGVITAVWTCEDTCSGDFHFDVTWNDGEVETFYSESEAETFEPGDE